MSETPVCQIKMLKAKDVAQRYGVSVGTVLRWRKLSVGPKFVKIGFCYYWREEDLLEYEKSRIS